MMRVLLIVFLLAGTSMAGEWSFRLKDAHLQLRAALFERNADAAWEHVDRETRQQAGILAWQIREGFDGFAETKRQELRASLGSDDDQWIRSIRGRDLLVAPFFLEAHPCLLVGDPSDQRLKDHGMRMAGPTGVLVAKGTSEETLVPYTFSVENHFGCQAMDYRARLDVPALESILGQAPRPPRLSPEDVAAEALEVFERAREALAAGDVETLWPLLDCLSQSQACHFADQARERGVKDPVGIAGKLDISEAEVLALDGRKVWALPWATQDLEHFLLGTEPAFVDAGGYDGDRLRFPDGYRHRGKPLPPEQVIEFRSGGEVFQIPVKVNHRNGLPELKICLRPPFYLRLRR